MTDHEPDRVEYRMERAYEVAATPEQVWDVIAMADGIAAWMVPTRLDPQVGGEVSFNLAPFPVDPLGHRLHAERSICLRRTVAAGR